jgi:hypothetical protein
MNDERLDRIEGKLDKLVDQAGVTNVTLARLTDSVEIHEKRSDALEKNQAPMMIHLAEAALHKALMARMMYIIKWATAIMGSIATAATLILKIMGKV